MNRYTYSRFLAAMLCALAGVWLLAACGSRGDAVAQEKLVKPTVVPPTARTPAPTPEDQREVAILTLIVKAGKEGKVEAVELQKGQIVRSYAPNVLGLSGPWTVELAGEQSIKYGTLNPLQARVYDDEKDQEVPHSGEALTETTWELVVPLWDQGKDLGVKEINIYDENGNLIFSTPVDREKWRTR
jgi:hypothetical protein